MQVQSTRTLIFKNPATEAKIMVRPVKRGFAVVAPDWIADDPYFPFCVSGDDPVLTVLGKGTKIPKSKLVEAVDPKTAKKKEPENAGLGGPVKPFSI